MYYVYLFYIKSGLRLHVINTLLLYNIISSDVSDMFELKHH